MCVRLALFLPSSSPKAENKMLFRELICQSNILWTEAEIWECKTWLKLSTSPKKPCFLGQRLSLAREASWSIYISTEKSIWAWKPRSPSCRNGCTKLLVLDAIKYSLSQSISLVLMLCSLNSLKTIWLPCSLQIGNGFDSTTLDFSSIWQLYITNELNWLVLTVLCWFFLRGRVGGQGGDETAHSLLVFCKIKLLYLQALPIVHCSLGGLLGADQMIFLWKEPCFALIRPFFGIYTNPLCCWFPRSGLLLCKNFRVSWKDSKPELTLRIQWMF